VVVVVAAVAAAADGKSRAGKSQNPKPKTQIATPKVFRTSWELAFTGKIQIPNRNLIPNPESRIPNPRSPVDRQDTRFDELKRYMRMHEDVIDRIARLRER
jgi:hypothetical protein